VLAVIYDKLGGDYWFDNTDWLNGEVPHCDWFGIKCKEDRVSSIILQNNNLTGKLSFDDEYGNQQHLFDFLFALKEL
jgi:hypothetical protein